MRKLLFYSCPYCGICGKRIISIKDASGDHVIPYSRHGKTVADNMQLAHLRCNLIKAASILPSVYGESIQPSGIHFVLMLTIHISIFSIFGDLPNPFVS